MSFHNGELLRQHATATMPPPPPPPADDMADVPHQPVASPLVAQTIPTDFEAASQQIAEVEAAHERAQVAVREAQGRLDQVNARIATLEAEKAGIVTRRTAGECQDDDGPRLALLDADVQGLMKLRHDAAGVFALAQSEARSAEHNLQLARDRLRIAEETRQHAVLSEHATELSALLRQTLERLLPLETNLSPSRCWAPSPALIEALRRSAFSARKGW